MRFILPFLGLALLVVPLTGCLGGCGGSHSGTTSSPPPTPVQTPGTSITNLSEPQKQAQDAIDELNAAYRTIRSNRDEWRLTKASSAGPQLSTEALTLAKQIIEDCNTLEQKATALLGEPFLKDHKGGEPQLSELIKLAKQTRDEVSR